MELALLEDFFPNKAAQLEALGLGGGLGLSSTSARKSGKRNV